MGPQMLSSSPPDRDPSRIWICARYNPCSTTLDGICVPGVPISVWEIAGLTRISSVMWSCASADFKGDQTFYLFFIHATLLLQGNR